MFSSDEAAYQIARAIGPALAIALVLAVERWRPHAQLRPAWRANLGLWAIDSLLMASVCGACGWVVAAWAAEQGLGLATWAQLGRWPALVFSVLALDAVSWGWHRANHRVRVLWRFHQVHHADTAFSATTALRFHPGELLLALPVRLAAVVLLGVPPEGVLVFEALFGVANVVEHGNVHLPPGLERALRTVLVTPTLHRGHHVADWTELDTNFGTVFSLWDRLARSFRASDARRQVSTGLPGRAAGVPESLRGALLLPLRTSRSPGAPGRT